MKKILFAALAALAITSCSQNEEIEAPSQKTAMEFNGVVGKAARAVVADLTELQKADNGGFKVYAYNIGETGIASTEKPIMENEAITYSSNIWSSNTTYYWPAKDKVAFYAYFSKIVDKLVANTGKTAPTIASYTVPTASTDQEDLLVATIASQDKSTPTVNFQFNHALTQVNFSILPKKADNAKLTYTITGITLTGISNAGSYDFGTSTWTPTATTANYEYTISSSNNTVTGNATVATDVADNTKLLMLLPQTIDNAKATIKYKVTDTSGTLYYETEAAGKEINLKGATISEWLAGKKVRYTLLLTNDATPIEWAAEPVEWTSESNKETGESQEPTTPAV